MRTSYTVNGLRVAQARQELRVDGKPVSQAALARMVGLHFTTMNRIENDKARVSRETLEVLAAKLGRTTEWLLGNEDDAQVAEEAMRREQIASALEPLAAALFEIAAQVAAREAVSS